MQARLTEVVDVIHRTPTLASPVGLVVFPKTEMQFHNRTYARPQEDDRRWLAPGQLHLAVAFYEPDGKTVYDSGSAFTLHGSANNLSCLLNNASAWGADAEGTMYLDPPATARREAAVSVYAHCVAMTHRPGPLFVPVSRERVMNAKIAEMEKLVAGYREVVRLTPADARAQAQEMLTTVEGYLKAMRDELTGLSADARRAPGTADDAQNPFAAIRGSRPVVQVNPAYFDPARPADIQLLTLFEGCVPAECNTAEPYVTAIFKALDWKALDAIVK
jgi:hypothetical protein